ncbi:carbohydrate kinase family protein [Arcticibacter tournemirensis]|uniref:Carbohydrate kinase n=1 Tax=Arcticibacter tournemirensis TaxID=699437 RepID=A0A4Q0MBA3_9SPHI|nr:carbohydrate kinase [Arcticibacter tournemirensis]RXF70557.1 carbohydrate kinase [Arcticibacter tournemirensis]
MNTNETIPAICYGEILWDVLPDGPQPGGAPLNVAYHLNKLGLHASLISRVGKDENGRKLETLLDQWGINRRLLQQDSDYPTSEVIAKMNNRNEVSYEIVFPVAWDFINEVTEISRYIQSQTYFVYGSLASRNNITRATLSKLLENDSFKVFDINLRPPFVEKSLLLELLEKSDLVKFNESELEMAQTLFHGSYRKEADQIKFIQDRFNISEVVVTKGEFGASYYKGNEAWHCAGREVRVADTIGSGDAFLAAFLANHYLGEQPQIILRNAIAMGGFVATHKGGCPDYDVEEYIAFRRGIFE